MSSVGGIDDTKSRFGADKEFECAGISQHQNFTQTGHVQYGMKLHLLSAYPTHEWLTALLACADDDRVGRHELCDDPHEADVILFVENAQFDDYLYKRLLKHPLVQMYPEKTFMYNEVDRPWCVLPGIYACMPANRYDESRQVAFPYLVTPNRFVPQIHRWQVKREWLFSFVGASSHPLRRRVTALNSVSEGVRDTSDFNVWHSDAIERSSQGLVFAESMARSHFVLCPRGLGTSSYRPFEAMQAARAPVIISDEWVAPPHVDWDFALFVPEKDVEAIPDLLAERVSEAGDRGQAARRAWEMAYSPTVLFDTVAESMAFLLQAPKSAPVPDPWLPVRNWWINTETTARQLVRRLRTA